MLTEGEDIKRLASTARLERPVLAVGGFSGEFTATTIKQVASNVTSVLIDNVGHYVAMEAPDRLSQELVSFFSRVDVESEP